jgi:hypothetical protein
MWLIYIEITEQENYLFFPGHIFLKPLYLCMQQDTVYDWQHVWYALTEDVVVVADRWR